MISVPADGLAVVYEENKMLREELADARARHRDYSSGIAEALGHERLKRDTGEPARSDKAEIEELKRELEQTKHLLHTTVSSRQPDGKWLTKHVPLPLPEPEEK